MIVYITLIITVNKNILLLNLTSHDTHVFPSNWFVELKENYNKNCNILKHFLQIGLSNLIYKTVMLACISN